MDIELKYGLNPHQGSARLTISADPSPLTLLNGKPGYINLLDAFGAWQLAKELKAATGLPGAASFKHVSPAGAAIGRPLSDEFRKAAMIGDEEYSPVAAAYLRARGGDRMSSFGDAAAVSDVVDASLARAVAREVSDMIIAPGYEPEALEILRAKKGGNYLVLQIDPGYEPPAVESRDAYGFVLQEQRNTAKITKEMFARTVTGEPVPDDIQETLAVATIALKYTQSNSVCLAYDGQVVGMGAGQQSRVHCTRLACSKADKWFAQLHPKTLGLKFADSLMRAERNNVVDQYLIWDELSAPELDATLAGLDERPEPVGRDERLDWIKQFDGICLSSDAFIPFRDNIDRASRTNVKYIAQPGGSSRDDDVTAAAASYGMAMIHTGLRCFLH
jgi:phosphoribosylaminoimidazolecarboxamide formyltransferase/IMP cyclohydrolase